MTVQHFVVLQDFLVRSSRYAGKLSVILDPWSFANFLRVHDSSVSSYDV